MSEMQTLKNTSDVIQHVYVDKKRWELPPYGVLPFKAEIAEAFLEKCGRYVHDYGVENQSYAVPGQATVWIANMTGNPFLPKKLKRLVIRKGQEAEEVFDNPLCKPKVIRERIRGGQTETQIDASSIGGDPNETVQINFPPRVYELYPYQRKPFARTIGVKMMEFDGYREEEWQGQVMGCREPTAFEPNDSWTYDELRLYGLMIDRAGFTPLMEEKFLASKDFKGKANGVATIENLKVELLQHLFFRIVDPKYNLIDEEDFETEKKKLGI